MNNSTFFAKAQLKDWGNSLALRIPKKVRQALGLHDGSQVSISVEDNKIILQVEGNEFFNLSQNLSLTKLTDKITKTNQHAEQEDYKPAGKELW
jgi:antitoxin MazE